jgi:predicted amino acid racemase
MYMGRTECIFVFGNILPWHENPMTEYLVFKKRLEEAGCQIQVIIVTASTGLPQLLN